MESVLITDYQTICRMCLCKGSQANQICTTQDNGDLIKAAFDCTSILVKSLICSLNNDNNSTFFPPHINIVEHRRKSAA